MVIIFEPVEILGKEKAVAESGAGSRTGILKGKFSKNGVAPRNGENIKITFDGFK